MLELLVPGATFVTHYSDGSELKARQAATRCAAAQAHLEKLFGIKADLGLFVLSRQDWAAYASSPVYGLPHFFRGQGRLVVAAEPADFWRSLADIIAERHADHREELASVYGFEKGQLDLSRFFDLIVVHEVGHAFQFAGDLSFPRSWLQELFANLCLYSYVAAREPAELRTLHLAVELLLAADHPFRYRSLADFERLYSDVGPENYCWYQFKLCAAAWQLLQRSGDDALRRLWRDCQVDDAALASRLGSKVDPSLGELMRDWER